MTDATDAQLAEQYEAYPYPRRDPREEAKRLVVGSPGHLLEVDHWVFGATRPASRPLNVLVAGGGTGDATIMLAQHLATAGRPGTVTWLDRSAAALKVARARAEARGLPEYRLGAALAAGPAGFGPGAVRLHRLLRRAAPPARSGRRVAGVALGAGTGRRAGADGVCAAWPHRRVHAAGCAAAAGPDGRTAVGPSGRGPPGAAPPAGDRLAAVQSRLRRAHAERRRRHLRPAAEPARPGLHRAGAARTAGGSRAGRCCLDGTDPL